MQIPAFAAKYIWHVLAFIAVATVYTLGQWLYVLPDANEVSIWVFDVGQGDAIFIDAPDAQVLIDGGPGDSVIEQLTKVLPFWDRHIDYLINTHPHADHVSGIVEVAERYNYDYIWSSGQQYHTLVYAEFESLGDAHTPEVGEVINLGLDATLQVLWPGTQFEDVSIDDPNEGSIVLLLKYGDTSMLLTGDIGYEQERALIEKIGDIDVLKVSHQGSMTSTDWAFLESSTPEYAIISVGENSYGHPHEIVLSRLSRIEANVYRTDQDGSIRVRTWGGEPEIQLYP